jgi:hypothetical protein
MPNKMQRWYCMSYVFDELDVHIMIRLILLLSCNILGFTVDKSRILKHTH